MEIKLRPETLEKIQQWIDSGQFEDANAVIAAGLELIRRKEQYEELKAAIDVGYQQYLRGEVFDMDDEFRERVTQKASAK